MAAGVLALHAVGASAPASAATPAIHNDTVWHDSGGAAIHAHSGGILQVGTSWYWFGREFGITAFQVNVYVSSDLAHWRRLPPAFNNDAVANGKSFSGDAWIGRPDVLYNAATKTYVMTLEFNYHKGERNQLAFLTSKTPAGPFVWQTAREVRLPGGYTMGDKGVFEDADGSAYLLFVSDEGGINKAHKIARFSWDYLRLGAVVYSAGGGGHEALSVVHRSGQYYLFSSLTKGWKSSATMFKRAAGLGSFPKAGGDDGLGWKTLATSPLSANSYDTQHDFVLTIHGSTSTSYMYAGDRWNDMDPTVGGTGNNGWYPLTFDTSGAPHLHGLGTWCVSTAAGTWWTAGCA